MIELEGSTCGGSLVKFFFLYKLFPGAYDPEARSMEFNSDLCVSRDDVLNLFFDGVTGIFTWQQRTVRAKQCRCFCPFECAVRSQLANGRTQGTERRTSVSPKQGLNVRCGGASTIMITNVCKHSFSLGSLDIF